MQIQPLRYYWNGTALWIVRNTRFKNGYITRGGWIMPWKRRAS